MNRPSFASLVAVVPISLAASACSVELGDSTLGDLGRVEFSYASKCLFGCSLDRPLLAGTDVALSVSDPGDPPGVVAVSTAPDVATFSVEVHCSCERSGEDWAEGMTAAPDEPCPDGFSRRCDNLVTVHALRPGDAQLELRDGPDGELIDRATVLVRDPESATFERSTAASTSSADPAIRLQAGQSDGVLVRLFDSAGQQLLVTGNVRWSVGNSEVAGFSEWFGSPSASTLSDDVVSVQGVAPGSTQLTVQAGGLVQSAPLVVTP